MSVSSEMSEELTFVSVTLEQDELWRKFYEIGTEMIITKAGRRMFPSLVVSIRGLNPTQRYYLFLDMTLAEHSRFRYSEGWQKSGPAETTVIGNGLFCHPDSPSTGYSWMSGEVSFDKLKLTNNGLRPGPNQIVLTSMHKYLPRLRIVPCESDSNQPAWAYAYNVPLLLAEFIAVTAYQSHAITRMKIYNNPFAKGFRDTEEASERSRKRKEKQCVKRGKKRKCFSDENDEMPLNLSTKPNENAPAVLKAEPHENERFSDKAEGHSTEVTIQKVEKPLCGNTVVPFPFYHPFAAFLPMTSHLTYPWALQTYPFSRPLDNYGIYRQMC